MSIKIDKHFFSFFPNPNYVEVYSDFDILGG